MDAERTRLLRELLAGTEWATATRGFARALRGGRHGPGGLLLVGTPAEEPWHLAAHLGDEARAAGVPALAPVLVRHRVPVGAPAHLAVDLSRLAGARRGESVFIVAPDAPGEGLLERVADARRAGSTVFALDGCDGDLRSLAHEQLSVAAAAEPGLGARVLVPDGLVIPADPAEAFALASHLVSAAAGEPVPRGFRARLARVLDAVSGPAPVR